MADPQHEIRVWVRGVLGKLPRGSRSLLASRLDLRPDAITRIANVDAKSKKEPRRVGAGELIKIIEFFDEMGVNDVPAAIRQFVKENAGDLVRVPLLSWVSAGKLRGDLAQPIPVADVPLLAFSDLGRGDFFALKVEGDSMDRLSPDGSVIIVNRLDKTLIRGKPYVFAVRGKATYKLWESSDDVHRLEPYSFNPAHKAIFPKRDGDMEVVGRVRRTMFDL